MLKTLLCSLGAFVLFSSSVLAQEWQGLNMSSYSGMHAGLYNPAMLSVSHMRLQIGIVGTNSQINTNLLQFTGRRGLGSMFKGYQLTGEAYDNLKRSNLGDGLSSLFASENWKRVQNGEQKDFSITAEARGPFLAGTVGPLGWGVGYRMRGGLQFRDVSPVISDLFFSGVKNVNPVLLGTSLKDSKFSASINAYHEWYGSFAFPLLQIGPHYLAGGVTLKYLAGMYSAAIVNRGLEYELVTEDSLFTTRADLSYQYIDNPVFAADPTAPRGTGVGADLGVIYELRGTNEALTPYAVGQGHHLIRAGVSLIDFGQITYSGRGTRKFDFQKVTNINYWGSIDTLKVKGAAGLDSLFSEVFGAQNQKSRFSTGLPTMVNVFADFRILQWFYVGVNASQNLVGVSKSGLRSFSSVAFLPRFESKMFEFGLPVTVGSNYKYVQPGFYARVSGFYFGSDNLSTIFNAQGRTGISFYAGGFVPLYRQ